MSECPVESSSKVMISTRETLKNKADEDLRRFSTAVRTSLDGIITGDLNGSITDVNDAVLRMYGATNKGDLIGKNVLDFVVERDRDRALRDSMESMRTGQGRTTEYRALTRNGIEVPVEITTGFIRDEEGEPIGFVDIIHNISERKKAELKLQESEKKYKELADQLPVIVYEIDCKGKFTLVNKKGLEITGYSYEDFENGLNILDLVTERDREKARTRIQRTLNGEKVDYIEYTLLRKDGSTFPAIACVNAIVREGKTTGLRGIVIDISERKKTGESLKESEEKFRNLAEQLPNMIFINQKGRVVYVNREAEDAMGYQKEEYYSPGFSFLTLVAPESRELVELAFNKHTNGEDLVPYECKLITKEGREMDAIISSRLIKYHGEPAILGIVTDITDRKKVERMTLESQQSFKALFIGNPEAAAYLAPDFHILDVNPRFEELFGYSLDDAKGKHINDLIVESTRMDEAEALDKNAIIGYVYHNTIRKRKDGSLVPVAVSVAPMNIEDKLTGYIVMYRDISDLKSAEAAMSEMMQEAVMINEKLRVVGGLTRHDVRNKLSIITGNIYLNKKRLGDHSDVLRNFDEMASACEQIVRIFDFAKDYEMLGVEELTYIDVDDAVRRASSLFSDLNGVEVTNECHGLTVLADSLLRQLFYNLIDNSLKYGRKTTRINVHFEKTERDELRVFYEDDGVGISNDEKPNLFKEGYTTGKGSGYGLYLIMKLIEVYGWTIQETGKPSKGVQFTITIPKINQNGKENYHIV